MLGFGRFFKNGARKTRLKYLRFKNRKKLVFDTIYKYRELNTRLLDEPIKSFSSVGVDTATDNNIVISLTSFPERMNEIHYALYSLLTQSLKPQKLILWLAREQFPRKEYDIPQKVLQLRANGLEIAWTHDTRSFKKLVPALQQYPENIIVTADDDIFYPKDWLERLYLDYDKSGRVKNVYAHMVQRIVLSENGTLKKYRDWRKAKQGTSLGSNFAVGCGGILYPPGVMHHDIFKKDLFLQLAPLADDVFFWAMAVINKCHIKKLDFPYEKTIAVNARREGGEITGQTLFSENVGNGKNDVYLNNVLSRYPQILKKLLSECSQYS